MAEQLPDVAASAESLLNNKLTPEQLTKMAGKPEYNDLTTKILNHEKFRDLIEWPTRRKGGVEEVITTDSAGRQSGTGEFVDTSYDVTDATPEALRNECAKNAVENNNSKLLDSVKIEPIELAKLGQWGRLTDAKSTPKILELAMNDKNCPEDQTIKMIGDLNKLEFERDFVSLAHSAGKKNNPKVIQALFDKAKEQGKQLTFGELEKLQQSQSTEVATFAKDSSYKLHPSQYLVEEVMKGGTPSAPTREGLEGVVDLCKKLYSKDEAVQATGIKDLTNKILDEKLHTNDSKMRELISTVFPHDMTSKEADAITTQISEISTKPSASQVIADMLTEKLKINIDSLKKYTTKGKTADLIRNSLTKHSAHTTTTPPPKIHEKGGQSTGR
ncbi:MAG: hypothetical protein V4485_00890 [Pseudomonadota bacterium]